MSLLWPERLLVSLQPRALAWARGGVRRRIEADSGYGPEPWHGVMEAFKLEAAAWRRERLQVRVVLSNAFARYALVPRQADAATREEEQALGRFQFARIHGERARGWAVRLAGARLACAIDDPLLDALRACFGKGARARLVSVQSFLASAYNRWRGHIPREGAWLVLEEPERVCVALLDGREWRALHNAQAPADWCELLERERTRAGRDALPATVLLGPQHGRDLLPLDDAPRALRLGLAA